MATSSPSAGASNTDFEDACARFQAMGKRLTREEYDRTRAGVTAFLRAERPSPSPAVASSSAATASSSQPQASRPTAPSSTPSSTSDSKGTAQSSGAPQRSSGSLSFFTAVVAPETKPQKPKPKLEDISSMAEKKRREHRRERLQQKLNSSLSEPASTPRISSLQSPSIDGHPSSSAFASGSSAYASSPQCGLGLQGVPSASSSVVGAATPGSSPLEAFPRGRRHRTTSERSRAALSSSADLQAATSSDAEQRGVGNRAWLSPSGRLTLMSTSEGQAQKTTPISSPQLGGVLDPDDSGVVVVDSGFDGASKAGWGSRRRAESAGSAGVSESMAKLGLLERVMKDKRSPRRLRQEAKAKRAAERMVEEERSERSGAEPQTNLGPSLPINEMRKHSRQMSKNVRWGPTLSAAPSSHERMTTRDHYEFFVHGIAPGQPSLGDLDVDDEMSSTPASVHEAMPWLFSSHSQSSPTVQRRGTFVSDDLAVDLTSMIEGDMDDLSSTSLFNPRRGLLFPGSSLVQQSPTQPRTSSAGLNLFSAGFTDPSLSQSPARPLLHHMASSPARLSISGGRGRPRAGSMDATGSPSMVRSKPQHQQQHRLLGNALDTISPAAVFGGGVVAGDASGASLSMPPPPLPAQVIRQAPEQQSALPEPTKRAPNDSIGLESSASGSDSPVIEPPVSKMPGQARLMVGQSATLNWGEGDSSTGTADLVISAAPDASAAKAKQPKKGSSSSNRRPAAAPSSTPASSSSTTFSLPPGADMSKTEWDRPDGSRIVKLVSEELQAAIEARGADFVEPPPRYYVLPPGFGSTKAKPSQVSYAGLIGQAIKTSSDQRLSLAEVYQWISTVHPFFERGDRGWQNSIRHNLSLNKSFIKVERESNMPGKGGWWAIKEGHAERFQNGVYNAVPSKPGSALPSKKKAAATMPGPPTASTPAAAAPPAARKRQPTNEADSAHSSPSRSSPPRQVADGSRRSSKSGKSLKKPKLGALGGANEGASRLPLGVINHNRITAQQQQVHHAAYANVFESTPVRPENAPHYIASSGGMPMLTDSASSPPSSPPPTSDAVMPPPSSSSFGGLGGSGTSSGKKNRARMSSYGGQDGQLYAGGVFGNHFAAAVGGSQFTNPFFNSGGGGGNGHGYQASPLANRVRGGANARGNGNAASGATAPGSPLRRQAVNSSSSLTGSPGKIGSPVSSVREDSQSSSAGAFTMRTSNPFATARASPVRGGQHDANLSPVRGSVSRMSAGGNNTNSPLRFAQAVSSPATSAQLQMAMHQQQPHSSSPSIMAALGPSYGGLGLGMTKTGAASGSQLTPARNANGSALLGISPSPTVRRFQQQQAASTWLEDPFDYQGVLQHELESMGLPTATASPQHAQMSGGHSGSGNGLLGIGGFASNGGQGGGWATTPMMGVSPMRGGGGSSNWLGGQDNISAVRGSGGGGSGGGGGGDAQHE